jgi:hypothetical protein
MIKTNSGCRLTICLTLMIVAVYLDAAQGPYDLLLKNGHVIDLLNGVDGKRDVAIAQGKIAAVAADIPLSQAQKVADVAGLYVVPGLIDLHCPLRHHWIARQLGRRQQCSTGRIQLPDGCDDHGGCWQLGMA